MAKLVPMGVLGGGKLWCLFQVLSSSERDNAVIAWSRDVGTSGVLTQVMLVALSHLTD